jgi:hypothetical protein
MTDRLEELIAASSGATRAEKIHAAALTLRETSAHCRILLCEVSWEAAERGYWRELRPAYPDQWTYLAALWGASTTRKSGLCARKRLGKALSKFPPTEREWLREQLARIGLSRALLLGPVLLAAEDVRQAETWLHRAADPRVPHARLRRWITEAYDGGARRAHTVGTPGDVCPTCQRAWRKKLVAPSQPAG